MPRKYTHWASTVLFVYFGLKLLHEAYSMDANPTGAKEELEEVEQELAEDDGDMEEGVSVVSKTQVSILIQAFTLTFLAEWGDRSQIATIALASAKDPYGVTLGGVIGHGFCTGLAVIGGRLLATRISERTVAMAGKQESRRAGQRESRKAGRRVLWIRACARTRVWCVCVRGMPCLFCCMLTICSPPHPNTPLSRRPAFLGLRNPQRLHGPLKLQRSVRSCPFLYSPRTNKLMSIKNRGNGDRRCLYKHDPARERETTSFTAKARRSLRPYLSNPQMA